MKISKIALALLCVGTLAFTACGKKDEDKKGTDNKEAPKAADGDKKAADGDKKAAEGDTKPVAVDGDKKAAEPAAGGEISDADMEKGRDFMLAMAKAVADNKDDCGKLAGGLNKVFDDNADVMKAMSGMKDNVAAQKKWEAKYKDATQKTMMKMMADVAKCMKDPAVMKAMARMN